MICIVCGDKYIFYIFMAKKNDSFFYNFVVERKLCKTLLYNNLDNFNKFQHLLKHDRQW